MASIQQRGNSWRVSVCKSGVRKTATFDTQREAKLWAAKLETQIHEHNVQAKGITPGKTFHQACDRYLNDVAPTHKGYRWERIRTLRFKREIADVPLLQILKGTHLTDWRDERLKCVSKAAVRRDMAHLSQIFEAAKEWKWITANPMSNLKRPPKPPDRDRIIAQHEIDAVVAQLGYTGGVPRNKKQLVAIAFLLSLETAMRGCEILGLRRGDINFEKRFLSLHETKNGDKRDVPLSTRAVELLRWVEQFPGAKGWDRDVYFPLTGDVREQYFALARKEAGFKPGLYGGFNFHDARATALTRLSKKLDVLALARMVGHRDPRSLMIYYREKAEDIALKLD